MAAQRVQAKVSLATPKIAGRAGDALQNASPVMTAVSRKRASSTRFRSYSPLMAFRSTLREARVFNTRLSHPSNLEPCMKKKSELEADLDPKGTRHTRPGSKIADMAIALSKPAHKRRTGAAAPSRPGATAAARAVAATKAKRKRSR